MFAVGDTVAGKYRIERELGRGGMGLVVAATHVHLNTTVALKFLHDPTAAGPNVVARFLREARASAQLRSDHVCRVLDYGSENDIPYIVMELLVGTDLGRLIRERPLAEGAAAEMVRQACEGLAEAHAAHIVHRDLKPSNLFLTHRKDGSPLVKVFDFGIAKAPEGIDVQLTQTQSVVGSPGFMSPEQLRSSKTVDSRSDIWALGVILYELISGRLPFEGETITELAVKVTIDQPAPLDGYDPNFTAVVFRCLEKDPANRYQTINELAAALTPFGSMSASTWAGLIARLSGSHTAPIITAQQATSRVATTIGTAAGQNSGRPITQQPPEAPPKKKRGWIIAASALLVTGAAAATVVAIKSNGSGSGGTKPPAHHDAGVVAQNIDAAAPLPTPDAAVIVEVPSDAAVATSDAGDSSVSETEMRDKIHELAKNRDWYTLLQLAELAPQDPAIASDVAAARKGYLAQIGGQIDAAVRSGQCSRARELAASASKLITDDTTLAAKAKTCVTRVEPPAPTITLARNQLQAGQYGQALDTAERLLRLDPMNDEALRIAAMSSCQGRFADKAKIYVNRLTSIDRKNAVEICERNGISFEPPRQPIPDIEDAEHDEMLGDYNNALSKAQKILLANPNSVPALRVATTSACHLHRTSVAIRFIKRIPPGNRKSVEKICADLGVRLTVPPPPPFPRRTPE